MLEDARSRLIVHYPFFGVLALRLNFIESSMEGMLAQTMGVTADKKLYYNPKFVESLKISDVVIVFCHEILHLVQRVHSRFPMGGNPGVWNLASDYAVNTMILDSGLVADKEDHILDKIFPEEAREFAKGKGTEEMYILMMREEFTPPEPRMQFGDKFGDEQEGEGNSKEGKHPCNGLGCQSGSSLKKMDAAQRLELEENILAAAAAQDEDNRAKGKGDLPGWMQDFLTKVSRPTITWKDHLRRAAYHHFKNRYNWSRPGRRSEAIGVRLPARKPTPKGAIVAIDTSGSISDQELTRFLSECVGIMDACGAPWIEILLHDTRVYLQERYTRKTIGKMKVCRGGTSHIDVFQKIDDSKQKVGMVICFTDLASDFPPQPKYPVIWAVPEEYANMKEPWGKKLLVKNEGTN